MVRFDDALKEIFGWNRMPCVSTYTKFFKKFNRECVDNVFGKVNKWFFEQIPEKTITLDLDSSVITRYGSQEGSLVGYNPRKPGRPSRHPIMAFIADMRMVAHSWLRPGNTGSANGANIFLICMTIDTMHGLQTSACLRLKSGGYTDKELILKIESKN